MKYGLPYKGSKNRLAEHIVRLMPKADHLIDLFCGGCAVSHAAMLAGKYKHIHINDCDWRPVTLFMDVLAGRYQDENRWISREQFLLLKDTDPYVAIIWSFGNNMRDYLYSREIEPLKRAIHYAIFYDDYKPAAELGHDLTFIDQLTDTRRKYIAVKRYFEQYGHFQQQSFEGGAELYKQAGALRTERMQSLESWGGYNYSVKRPGECQHIESRHCILQIAVPRAAPCAASQFGGGQNLTSSIQDYADVAIPKGSVVYCDIPYRDTNVYDKDNAFEYERFYDWCAHQTEPVFISSYEMPRDRFTCIDEITHRSTLSATANIQVTERIFIPNHQHPPQRPVQLSLF